MGRSRPQQVTNLQKTASEAISCRAVGRLLPARMRWSICSALSQASQGKDGSDKFLLAEVILLPFLASRHSQKVDSESHANKGPVVGELRFDAAQVHVRIEVGLDGANVPPAEGLVVAEHAGITWWPKSLP